MERDPPPIIEPTLPPVEVDLASDASQLHRAPNSTGPLAKAAYVLGSIGLLAATSADALAVAGRHTGFHLLGSIEFVQAAVVVLASAAMLMVTISRGHATVHIVTERLPRAQAVSLRRVTDSVSAIGFLLLAAGSAWVLAELWDGFEQTELLHIPLRWLRLLWIVFAILVAGHFVRDALRRSEPAA